MLHRALPHSRIIVRSTFALRQQQPMSSNIFKQISKVVGGFMGKRTTIGNAKSLLFNCKMQADNSLWHTRGLVGTDFRSKQILLMLHVWMIHKRLITEGKEGLLVQEALFDELWEDTSSRIRGQGINELSVNKYLKEVQGYSFRCCVELDQVMSMLKTPIKGSAGSIEDKARSNAVAQAVGKIGEEAEEAIEITPEQLEDVIVDEIGGVLWRLAYLRRDEIEVDHVLEFARYMRTEQQSLMKVSKEAIFDARVQWGPIPTWKLSKGEKDKDALNKHHKSGHSHSTHTLHQNRTPGYKGEWKEAVAPDGKTYYWNTLTRESRWDKPKDFDASKESSVPSASASTTAAST